MDINTEEMEQAARRYAVRHLNISPTFINEMSVKVVIGQRYKPQINPYHNGTIVVGEKWNYQKFNDSYHSRNPIFNYLSRYVLSPIKKLFHLY